MFYLINPPNEALLLQEARHDSFTEGSSADSVVSSVLREYEKKGLCIAVSEWVSECRDVNHAYVCNHLPLDISPIRLFLYDLKSTLLSLCRRKDSDDDEEESIID